MQKLLTKRESKISKIENKLIIYELKLFNCIYLQRNKKKNFLELKKKYITIL